MDDKLEDGRLKYAIPNKFVPYEYDYEVKVGALQSTVTFTPVAMSNRIKDLKVNGKSVSSRCPGERARLRQDHHRGHRTRREHQGDLHPDLCCWLNQQKKVCIKSPGLAQMRQAGTFFPKILYSPGQRGAPEGLIGRKGGAA